MGTVTCPPFMFSKEEASTAANTQSLPWLKPSDQFSVTSPGLTVMLSQNRFDYHIFQ